MNNRKAKLEEALAFKYLYSLGSNDYERGLNAGVEHENGRLAPLHAALIEAVEALEEQANCEDDGAGGYYTDLAGKALAKIDEVLKYV